MSDIPQSLDLVILAARAERVRSQDADRRAHEAIVRATEQVEVHVNDTVRVSLNEA